MSTVKTNFDQIHIYYHRQRSYKTKFNTAEKTETEYFYIFSYNKYLKKPFSTSDIWE